MERKAHFVRLVAVNETYSGFTLDRKPEINPTHFWILIRMATSTTVYFALNYQTVSGFVLCSSEQDYERRPYTASIHVSFLRKANIDSVQTRHTAKFGIRFLWIFKSRPSSKVWPMLGQNRKPKRVLSYWSYLNSLYVKYVKYFNVMYHYLHFHKINNSFPEIVS